MLISPPSQRLGELFGLEKDLAKIFPDKEIRREKNLELPNRSYSPRIDIVVGPLAIEKSLKEEYKRLLEEYNDFIKEIKKNSINKRHLDFDWNYNPRCFLAIEVEDTTQDDKKHVLGSVCNTHILGKVGIVVTYGYKKTLKNIHNYLVFAKKVKKLPEYPFKNVALITKKDFDNIINKFL